MKEEEKKKQFNLKLNNLKKHWRDCTDENYICVRSAFRKNYDESFFTLAQLSIEKYLKCILLYNEQSIEKHNHHSLKFLFKEVLKIDYVASFFLKNKKTISTEDLDDLKHFIIESFDGFEHGKYGIFSWDIRIDHLIMLDHFVFLFRRFCRHPIIINGGKVYKNRVAQNIQPLWKFEYQCPDGLFENILKRNNKRYDNHYKDLVFKNFYYGRKKKKMMINNKYRKTKNSPICLFKENEIPELGTWLKLPKNFKLEHSC